MHWKIKRFEELSVEEIYEILRRRNQVFIVEQQCPYDDADEKDKSAYHLFCEDKGQIVAYIRILDKGISYDEISIGRVLVHKEYRGMGLARQLMIKGMDYIENTLGEKQIRISAQKYLTDFYKSLGFKIVSSVYFEDNIPHIEMFYEKLY
ncbi:ElaA protein [Clostridium tetanomorphum]|uniref:GNAT family N-acetyltransferase n=1 Tax=Clostridium tetanomorphum TaxID=1553 RepID=A0A923EB94_CLOTT|nr:GNAT family N-acetyltransferase [Clostridium tetanomorphum]KAJ49280.1 acetyltransferase [Clostridium tetanomorphum DSM 665]KAJ53930.1 acetyltransferase [Clostridium tetanomorphum DSM 665]MBC2398086.1 GNAT family N-acetyltransferase [Clostridium tetanomorphum]MBP1864653.1 ElaA protein [Clostridium tetanomorphum]NRS84123.1 ElaA protein [Clostridium tetanomorphum]